jgi:hypothetical protein
VIVARTYDVEPALELASEIAAETPTARRVLLAMLETGNGPSGARREASGVHLTLRAEASHTGQG